MPFDFNAYRRERRRHDPDWRDRENERSRRNYAKDPARRTAKTAAWKQRNRERYLAYMREYNARISARRAALRARERAEAVRVAWREAPVA